MNMQLQITSHDYTRKVAIVGAGYVGSTIAYSLMLKELAHEIVLIDINKEAVNGEVMDIRHGIPCMGPAIVTNGEYSDIQDCDLIIVTAGKNRKPGETRLDMAADNVRIAKSVAENITKYYTKGVVLVVSNPVDIITYKMTKWFGLPKGMVFGTGCTLDSSRLVNVVADHVGLNIDSITAAIVGEHGEAQIPIWSKMSVAGIPIAEYCEMMNIPYTEELRVQMTKKVAGMGAEIIRGKGKTHYGIATCVCNLADAILNKRTIVANVTSVLEGEYGISDIAMSLPSIIHAKGVERRLVDKWNSEELTKFKTSAEELKGVIKAVSELE